MENIEEIMKDLKNMEENTEKIWKIQKKVVKRQGKFERKVS